MLRKFIVLYKPYLKLFLLVLASSILVGLIDLLVPALTSFIINEGIGKKDIDIIRNIALIMVVVYIIRVFLTYFVTLKGHMVGVSIEFDLRRNLFNKILKLPANFFDNNPVGGLMSRLTNDLNEISEVAHHGPEDLVLMIILSTGSMILMLLMNIKLALAILIIIPLVIVINEFSRKKFFKTNLNLKIKLGQINAGANDSFSGIRQVKAFVNEENEQLKFDNKNDDFFASKYAMYKVMARYFSTLNGYFGLMNLVVIILGSYLVYNNEMNIGQLTAFIMYVNLFRDPIMKFSNFITEYNKAASGYSRYLELMGFEEQVDNGKLEYKIGKGNDIEFKNVWFRYDEKSDYILKDFNLKIPAGKSVALVGESGAGKSTLCSIINRYYEIEKGEILIGGINIKDLSLSSLRSNIGLVSQDVYIFSGTLFENIAYGDLSKPASEVYQAASNASLDNVITNLEQGYNSYLGEHGTKLSGGQKQRVSLARVFLKNPEIMVLDEATSALDNQTEKEIQAVIEKISQNRTSIIVAHRLSTIRNVDEIVVVEKGTILEKGSHDQLVTKKGKYYELLNTSSK